MEDKHPSKEILLAFTSGKSATHDIVHLESHIAECEQCSSTLMGLETKTGLASRVSVALRMASATENDADSSLQQIARFLSPSPSEIAVGRIGHFDVLELVGRGGFGIVLKAMDVSLNRIVALKVLSPEFVGNDMARKRFLREARSAAAVRHENVVQIYAVSETPTPFLVMEYIPGETLQAKLDRNDSISADEIVRIGTQLARGLAAAHAEGLIHRDVKPCNILMERSPGTVTERVKLTDFGLARSVNDVSNFSMTGQIMGTPVYMSPEQVKGEVVDHRSDLFSLGSVLYTLCCGSPGFHAESVAAVFRKLTNRLLVPIRQRNDSIPMPVADLIDRLTAVSPSDRFQSAVEVADELEKIASGKSNRNTKIEPDKTISSSETAGLSSVRSNNFYSVRPWAWFSAIVAPLVLLAVFIIRTRNGEFILTTDDPQIAASLSENGGLVVEDRNSKQTYTLQAGSNKLPNGDYEFHVTTPGGLDLTTSKFQIRRMGEPVLATVTASSNSATPVSDSDGANTAAVVTEWSEPMKVPFVDGDATGANPTLTGDGLRIIFVSHRFGSASLLEATRNSVDEPFGVPQVVPTFETVDGPVAAVFGPGSPDLSTDGLTLVVYMVVDRSGTAADLWITNRETLNSPWQTLRLLAGDVNSIVSEYGPNLSADNLTLYWFRPSPQNYHDGDIWRATRPSIDDPFGSAERLGDIINSALNESHPCLSFNGLVLLFDRDTPNPKLWQANRKSVDEPFGNVELVPLPPSWRDRNAYAPTQTSDSNLLIFTSNVAPGEKGFDTGELWQSQRL